MTDPNKTVVKLPEVVLGIVRNDNGTPTHLALQLTVFFDAEAAMQLAHGLEDVAQHMMTEQRKTKGAPVGDVTD